MPEKSEASSPVIHQVTKVRRLATGGVSATIPIADKKVEGVLKPIPDNKAPEEHLEQVKAQGIRAHLVRVGEGIHRVLHEHPSKIRRDRNSLKNPVPDGQS